MRLPRHDNRIGNHLQGQLRAPLKHLKLKGLQPKTVEAYARAIRGMGGYLDHHIDDLSEQQLTDVSPTCGNASEGAS